MKKQDVHHRTTALNARVSVELKDWIQKFCKKKGLRSARAFILYSAQQYGYVVQSSDM